MNNSNRNLYILLSVILSLIVHVSLFMLSRNLSVPSMISDLVQKPSKHLNLGTVSVKPEDDLSSAKLKPTHEPVVLPPKLASQNFPGSRSGAAPDRTVTGQKAVDSIKIPKAPSPETLQKIVAIDGDKLNPARLGYNRLIVPNLPRGDLPSEGGGGNGGGQIELKLRVPALRPQMPDSRLLPKEDLAVIDTLLDVNLYKYMEADGSGYFRVDISPGRKANSLKAFEKDIVFCVDTSGSISKERLAEFCEGVRKAITLLGPGDRFEIISFKHRAFPLFGSLKNPSADSIRQAENFLKELQRSGSTNIYSALEPFTGGKFKTENRPLILFLASDGNVNTGEVSDSRSLINEISNRNQNNVSIYTFSSGRDRNPFLLDLLAYRNRGESFSPGENARNEVALGKFIGEVSGINVMDLDYQVSSGLSDETFPKKLPHLYSKHMVSIYGRFPANTREIGLRITGVDSQGARQELVFAGDLDNAPHADETLPRKWAEQLIYHLYSKLTAEYDDSLKMEIYRTAAKYGLDVPYLDRYLMKTQMSDKAELDFKKNSLEF